MLPRASTSRLSQRSAATDREDRDHDDDGEDVAEGGGEEEEDEHDEMEEIDLTGALEMLPIPCTISCAPGVPAILNQTETPLDAA